VYSIILAYDFNITNTLGRGITLKMTIANFKDTLMPPKNHF